MTSSDRKLVFLDADNTLWDTDGVFAYAQLRLLDRVEAAVGAMAEPDDRLAFVRAHDQEIARYHERGLRYPPVLLVEALAAALGKPAGVDAADAETIVSAYLNEIGTTPPLLRGVEPALEHARRERVRIIILTEGPKRRAHTHLSAHGLDHLVERVVEMRKTPVAYGRIARIGAPYSRAAMIGDQFRRDIEPALAAGLEAFHVPSRFRPSWERSPGGRVFEDLYAAVTAALDPHSAPISGSPASSTAL